jgi:hypothetical protein
MNLAYDALKTAQLELANGINWAGSAQDRTSVNSKPSRKARRSSKSARRVHSS